MLYGICIYTLLSLTMPNQKSMLCLGDSYTIGQSVTETQRFPEQTIELLAAKDINFSSPDIIARTGWTSCELIQAIANKKLDNNYDGVTLLIGVNDQFRGIDTGTYVANFEALLINAIKLAKQNAHHVFVLSIPDYSVTPFALNARQTQGQIADDIELFNEINKRIASQYHVHYINITPISKLAASDAELLATDKLHPSGKMYGLWAKELAEIMQIVYQ